MGLEKVKEEVLQKAKEKAEAIIKSGRQEINSLESLHEHRLEQERQRAKMQTQSLLDEMKRQELSSAAIDARNSLLRARKQLLDSVADRARQKLARMGPEERKELLGKLLKGSQDAIKTKTVYCSKEDAAIVRKLGSFSVSSADIIGGLILENEEKTIRIDLSYDSLLEKVMEQNLTRISNVLFGIPDTDVKTEKKTQAPQKKAVKAAGKAKKKGR